MEAVLPTHLSDLHGFPSELDAVELDQVVVGSGGQHGAELHANVAGDVNVAEEQHAIALDAAKAHGKDVVNLV